MSNEGWGIREEMMIGLFQYYRIGAAYLILLIHQQFWAKPLALGRLTGVAVPLFAAMAGFLFAGTLGRGDGVKTILLKKTKRILVPYAVWAVVYWIANGMVLDVLVKHEPLSIPGVRSWLLGGTACHLWFLPCLFLAFGLFAIGGWVINHVEHVDHVGGGGMDSHAEHVDRVGGGEMDSRVEHVERVGGGGMDSRVERVWGMMAFDVVVLALAVLSQFIQDSTSATFAGYVKIYFGRLLFYFALGHLLALGLKLMDGVKVSARLFIGGALVVVGCANMAFDWIQGLVWNPLLLVVGLIATAVCFRNVAVPKWVDQLAAASMGIYLVHVLFTSGANFALQKIGHSPLPALMGFALSVVLFAVSYLAVRLLPRKCF